MAPPGHCPSRRGRVDRASLIDLNSGTTHESGTVDQASRHAGSAAVRGGGRGEAAGETLSALLRDHILVATEVIAAAKAGDTTAYEAAQAEWSANGDAIAAFLAAANPNWSQAELEEMLQTHLDFTTDEVAARLDEDWEADIAAYDAGHEHMLAFADVLTLGIARQFPSRL